MNIISQSFHVIQASILFWQFCQYSLTLFPLARTLSSIKMSPTGNVHSKFQDDVDSEFVFSIMSIHCNLCIILPVFIFSVHFANVFWLKVCVLSSAPLFLRYLYFVSRSCLNSLPHFLIGIISPVGCVPLLVLQWFVWSCDSKPFRISIFFIPGIFTNACCMWSNENQIVSPY